MQAAWLSASPGRYQCVFSAKILAAAANLALYTSTVGEKSYFYNRLTGKLALSSASGIGSVKAFSSTAGNGTAEAMSASIYSLLKQTVEGRTPLRESETGFHSRLEGAYMKWGEGVSRRLDEVKLAAAAIMDSSSAVGQPSQLSSILPFQGEIDDWLWLLPVELAYLVYKTDEELVAEVLCALAIAMLLLYYMTR